LASRSFSVFIVSGGMPRPRSSISRVYSLATRPPLTWTLVPGGEYWTAFSISSASMWVTSATAVPCTKSGESVTSSTRAKSSISPIAPRSRVQGGRRPAGPQRGRARSAWERSA
jgi:hypothetical protein